MKDKSKKYIIYLSVFLICAIIFIAWSYLGERARPISLSLAANPGDQGVFLDLDTDQPALKAYITGEVKSPGVYEFQEGARLEDLLAMAGGPTENADLQRVNLSAKLRDEQQVIIPAIGEETTWPDAAQGPAPVNINTANKAELQTIPGVGAITAQAIIDYRGKNGPYKSIDELLMVHNIGEKTLESIRDYVTVK